MASRVLTVKMLIPHKPHDIYFDQILHTYTVFEISGKITKKIEQVLKNICHSLIQTTVHQAVGVHEIVLDHSTTTYCI